MNPEQWPHYVSDVIFLCFKYESGPGSRMLKASHIYYSVLYNRRTITSSSRHFQVASDSIRLHRHPHGQPSLQFISCFSNTPDHCKLDEYSKPLSVKSTPCIQLKCDCAAITEGEKCIYTGLRRRGREGWCKLFCFWFFFPFSSRPENSLFHIDYRMDTDQYLTGWTGLKKNCLEWYPEQIQWTLWKKKQHGTGR